MGEHYLRASNLVCGPLLEEEMSPSKEEEEESQGMGGVRGPRPRLTVDGGKDDSRVVVSNDVGVAVLRLVHLQV